MHCGLREVIQQTDSIYIASSSVLAELFFLITTQEFGPNWPTLSSPWWKWGQRGNEENISGV